MSDLDTQIGDGPDYFNTTPWSVLLQRTTKSRAPKRIDLVLQRYWRPVYAYVRKRWKKSNEDAKDLTQAFFVHLMEKKILDRADPNRGKFRSFLRTALEHYLINRYEADKAKRRGGDVKHVPLEEEVTSEQDFARDWAKGLVEEALEDLRKHYGKEKIAYVRVLELYDLEGAGTYEEIAKKLGISVWDVTNYLSDSRKRFRDAVELQIRAYCRTEKEFRDELKELFQN